uniref:Pre-rRNA processing protein n=1 Tax=Mycena chlorophos TaxID=658473 RepID=A0ABQ0M6P3_MYCCL|nr:predicted protein [Mycena chlorophos]
MSSSNDVEGSPQPIDKGKRRAEETEATERTPLLGSHSGAPPDDPPPTVVRQRLRSKLTAVFLVSLVFTIVVFAGAGLLAWSYASRASDICTDAIIHDGLVFRGPDRVDVLSISGDGGIRLQVQGRMGFDAGAVLGVNAEADDGFFEDIWKAVGRWGIRSLDRVSVSTSTASIVSQGIVLATVETSPLVVPLTANPPSDKSWLTRFSTPLLIRPTTNTTALVDFVREAWRDGWVTVKVDLGSVDVRGGAFSEGSWRRWFHQSLSDVRAALKIEIPPIPGLPHSDIPTLAQLVTLQTFSLHSTDNDSLELDAIATIPNPAPPSFNLTAPPLPFTIILPPNVHIASVSTLPFTLTHPNISLPIEGNVLPLPAHAMPLLSAFLSRYLGGQNNPILVSTPLINDLTLDLEFPAPNPRPRVLRNVTIRDMSIKPVGTLVAASGTVEARVHLPKGMDLKLHVARVFADVLVFDGDVPDDAEFPIQVLNDTHPIPPAPPLPDPLPPHAFARIRPDAWLPSLSGPVLDHGSPDSGAVYAIQAHLVDVPLDVLPGRQKEFSGFVSKVVFGSGDGAKAGILGVAAVGVEVDGLDREVGEMELTGLPFRGSVVVGKKGLKRDWGLADGVERTREEVERALRKLISEVLGWAG